MQTRLSTVADAHIIASFNKAMAFETEQKKIDNELALLGVENLMNQPQYGFYVVAEINSEIVASLMITYEWSDWRNSLIWWIQSVYVKPENRRQSAFKCMLVFVEQLAKQQNINCIRLYMEKENRTAHQVYLQNNFIETDYLMFEKKILF
ncbi:MAG: hypothetical protein RJA07_1293 [Bacteroidota bacterium]|jgi:RimJ/RimL family protein N-acetyltransferase